MQKKNRGFEQDTKSGLILPQAHFVEARLKWFEDLKTALTLGGVPWTETPEQYLAVRHTSGRYREFNTVETQLIPVALLASQIKLWADGYLTEDNVYRILSPSEQIRVSNQVREKPLKDNVDAQAALDRAMKQREDLRRQGFDPMKEGLQ